MALRAGSAHWFEVIVPRSNLARAVETLGATGTVQFERHGSESEPLDLSDLRHRLENAGKLGERFKHALPEPHYRPLGHDVLVETRLDVSVDRLRSWAEESKPLIRGIERFRRMREDLSELADFLEGLPEEAQIDLGRLASVQPPLRGALFVLPPDARVPPAVEYLVQYALYREAASYLLCVGREEALQEFEQQLDAHKARRIALPAWLEGTPQVASQAVAERIDACEEQLRKYEDELQTINERYRVAEALGDIDRLQWLVEQISGLRVSESLAWISGWCTVADGQQLRQVLEDAGIPAVVHLPDTPEHRTPPTILHNPRWAKPFELFVRLLGTPGAGESDPSAFVAVVAPLLFGYMFADVGQGAVLLAVGLVYHRRIPAMGLLVPGGVAAMAFGVLFGSVFCREDLLPALWTHPIEHPLEVLAPPLVFGAVLIVLGQLLSGLSAWWGGGLRSWCTCELGLVLLYVSAGLSLVWEWGVLGVLAGAVWYIAGHVRHKTARMLADVAAGLGSLAEEALRLVVNTLSFVRVGAFALAHAGLALAVVALAEASGGAVGLVVLAIGNIAIIALEGLVASVQTTRLVLFEFFIRFVRAEGRPFRPSTPPALAGSDHQT